jgi:hypothetical protein
MRVGIICYRPSQKRLVLVRLVEIDPGSGTGVFVCS